MIETYVTSILKTVLLPPGSILVILLIGLLLLKHKPGPARIILWLGFILGYLLSTPLVSELLQQSLQSYPALTKTQIEQSNAQAIVILTAGRYKDAAEYGGETVDNESLARARYGAYLHRLTNLPVVVSGGHVLSNKGKSLAKLMANALESDFGVHDIWLEDKSRNTAENAELTEKLLNKKGITTILLVAHATDMPRAAAIFRRVGVKVIPAPTLFTGLGSTSLFLFLPSATAIEGSYHALYEMVGYLWYAIRY